MHIFGIFNMRNSIFKHFYLGDRNNTYLELLHIFN